MGGQDKGGCTFWRFVLADQQSSQRQLRSARAHGVCIFLKSPQIIVTLEFRTRRTMCTPDCHFIIFARFPCQIHLHRSLAALAGSRAHALTAISIRSCARHILPDTSPAASALNTLNCRIRYNLAETGRYAEFARFVYRKSDFPSIRSIFD